MLDRKEIIHKAVHDCFVELYAKAQPSADYDALIQGVKDGTIQDTNKDPIYKRYYLSIAELNYIVNKYIEAYRFTNYWTQYIDYLIQNFEEGKGYRDISVKDGDDTYHREAERVPALADSIGKENAEIVIQNLKDFRNFYRFDDEESTFRVSIFLGASPSTNKETVRKYWKEQGIDVDFEDRNPDTFWYRDMYGDNWEEFYNDEY